MNEAQRLVVARDQFALKRQSDEALRLILPSYEEARDNILRQLQSLPEGAVERELWLRQQLVNIEGQFRAVGNRIYDVLPAEQVKAWEEALDNAKEYLKAGGVEPAGQVATLAGETTGGQAIEQSINLPTVDSDYIRPSITQQQVVAAARSEGFATLSPGGATRPLDDVLPGFLRSEVQNVERKLRTGFLLGTPTDQIVRELDQDRLGRAQVEAVVRTSMAEASQAAHNAFFDANEDLLPKTKSGYRWEWDASNDTRLCEICAPLDGARYKRREEAPSIPAHFNCRCRLLPITATAEMLREEGDEPDSSFLERAPVKYGKDGKRLPPPDGYVPVKAGGTAYSRPQKIDGKLYWVRRRDLPKGQTLAGDMLKRMNDENKLGILGTKKRVAEWNSKIGLAKYKDNPQQLVRDMLRPNGGAGAPPMKLGRGPKPKPPAPKAKPKAKPAAPRLDQFNQQFIESPELSSVFEAQGGSGKFMEKLFDKLEGPDQVGANVRKMREFMQKNGIVNHFVQYGEDISKTAANYSSEAINKVIRSQQATVKAAKRLGWDRQTIRITEAGIEELKKGDREGLEFLMGSFNKPGVGGWTRQSQGIVVTHMQGNEVVGKRISLLKKMKNSLEQSLEYTRDNSKRLPWSTIGDAKEQGWITTMIHEVGHQVHYRGLNAGSYLKSKHFEKGGLASVSQYGLTNEKERFAEAFVQYTLNPEGLKQHAPGLYSWVEEALEVALR